MAIDINPLQNPCVGGSSVQLATANDYVNQAKDFPHKIDETDFCKQVFESFGFHWGGHWRSVKDYQNVFPSKSMVFDIHLDKILVIFVQISLFLVDLDKNLDLIPK